MHEIRFNHLILFYTPMRHTTNKKITSFDSDTASKNKNLVLLNATFYPIGPYSIPLNV